MDAYQLIQKKLTKSKLFNQISLKEVIHNTESTIVITFYLELKNTTSHQDVKNLFDWHIKVCRNFSGYEARITYDFMFSTNENPCRTPVQN